MENQFGKYTLLKKLGDGGMAEVFLAEMKGPEGFSKRVAIKRILPHLSHDSVFTESFINEARLGGYLNHHNIVQTLDFGQIDGFYYLAMEYVQGVDLRQILQLTQAENTPLPLGVALDIAYQICEGLVYAHSATDADRRPLRMIHRDLKPSNILINDHGVVKIADFGVARAESNIAHTQLASGNPKGTVAYMSPEQAMGSLDLDQRADVFSLGSIFFELSSNERLYTASTYLGALRQAQDAEVGDRLAMVAGTPGRDIVVPLLKRALAPDRADRYTNSRAFSKDLRRTLMRVDSDLTLSDYIRDFNPRLQRSQKEAERQRPNLGESGGLPPRRSGSGRASGQSAGQGASAHRAPQHNGASPRSSAPQSGYSGGMAAGGGAGMAGQASPQDDIYTEMRQAFNPHQASPDITNPSSGDPGRMRSPVRTGQPTPMAPAEQPEVLSSQTLKPRSGSPARKLGGTMMAVVAAALLIVVGAVVTLAVMGRPSKVVVETDPAGAMVTLPDGRELIAPSGVRVPPEGLTITVTQKGYEPKDLPIPGGAPNGQIWRVKLQAMPANLRVVVDPPNAKLTVNGLPVGGASPYVLDDVASAERLDLEVSLEGYLPKQEPITLEPGANKAINITLEPTPPPPPPVAQNPAPGTVPAPAGEGEGAHPPVSGSTTSAATGYLGCNAMPKGGGNMWARVFIDGKFAGNTPMLRKKVPVGRHTVLLIAEDGRQISREITIKKGQTAKLLVEFD